MGENVLSDHYAAGSSYPPLKPGVLRIYSMKYCPYVQRALLVLEAKKIPYEAIHCNLQQKPEWLFEKHSLGKVPVLEQDNKILTESLIISDYLDEAYPENPLHASDPYQKAVNRILVENNTGKLNSMYEFLRETGNKSAQDEVLKKFHDAVDIWEKELKKRSTPYFEGEKPGMVDYMVWPWFERTDALATVYPDFAPEVKFPTISSWTIRMKSQPAVQALIRPAEKYIAYFKLVLMKK